VIIITVDANPRIALTYLHQLARQSGKKGIFIQHQHPFGLWASAAYAHVVIAGVTKILLPMI
jgi:hypothetical protein